MRESHRVASSAYPRKLQEDAAKCPLARVAIISRDLHKDSFDKGNQQQQILRRCAPQDDILAGLLRMTSFESTKSY
jgi:pantothenate synthetase